MSLAELIKLVAPPEQPLHVEDRGDLQQVENYLGTRLPADYVAFAKIYGTGCFGDETHYFWIHNFLRPDALRMLQYDLGEWESVAYWDPEDQPPDAQNPFEFEFFPFSHTVTVNRSRPLYLPCGHTVDGGLIGWLMRGSPDCWPVVCQFECDMAETFEMPLTEFLLKSLKHELRPSVWRPDFPEDIRKVWFAAGEHYHQRSRSASQPP